MKKIITAITIQKRNPDRVNIELDGEFGFGLSRLTAAWLKIGDHLDEQKIGELVEKDAQEVAYQRAIRLLARKARTESEIKENLLEKGFPVEQVNLTVEKLHQNGFINDERFAEQWVENRNSSHPRGQRLIKIELKKKGISEELIDIALNNSVDDEQLALLSAERYSRRLEGLDYLKFRQRLSDHLARRGFGYSTIIPVVKTYWEKEKQMQDNPD